MIKLAMLEHSLEQEAKSITENQVGENVRIQICRTTNSLVLMKRKMQSYCEKKVIMVEIFPMMTLMKMPWKYILICDLEEDNELNVSDSMEERISDDMHEEVTDTE